MLNKTPLSNLAAFNVSTIDAVETGHVDSKKKIEIIVLPKKKIEIIGSGLQIWSRVIIVN